MTIVKEITAFFGNSPQRLDLLHRQIISFCPELSRSCLKKQCSTRWVENKESIIVFKELYLALIASLDELRASRNGETAGKATVFTKAMSDTAFLVCLEVISLVLNVTKPLSKALKSAQETVVGALESVNSCKDVLRSYRSEETFLQHFKPAQDIYGDPISLPRLVIRHYWIGVLQTLHVFFHF